MSMFATIIILKNTVSSSNRQLLSVLSNTEMSLLFHSRFMLERGCKCTCIFVTANPIDYVLWAAENADIAVLKELLAAQPDLIHATDSNGYTPLHRAAYGNHVTTVTYLLSVGAKLDAKTEFGWTPLHSAANWNNYWVVARLLAAGAPPAAVSDGGKTVCVYWVNFYFIYKSFDIQAKRSRNSSFDVSFKDLSLFPEQTPLHLAAAKSHSKSTLITLLFQENGAHVAQVVNNIGEKPEDLARGHGIYGSLFEMVMPAVSYIKSTAFTCNPYLREEKQSEPE
jgi:ankyrin repeat protein